MSIQQISPNSVAANPANINPQVKTDQNTALPQADQNIQKSVKAIKTDTVIISQQALQKLSGRSNATDQAQQTGATQKLQYMASNNVSSSAPSSTAAPTAAATFSMFA